MSDKEETSAEARTLGATDLSGFNRLPNDERRRPVGAGGLLVSLVHTSHTLNTSGSSSDRFTSSRIGRLILGDFENWEEAILMSESMERVDTERERSGTLLGGVRRYEYVSGSDVDRAPSLSTSAKSEERLCGLGGVRGGDEAAG